MPGEALVTVEVPSDALRVGDVVQVLPGEKLPVDGEVLRGTSSVDESLLTGESMPVLKQTDGLVTGGTLNCEGVLVVRATATGATGALAVCRFFSPSALLSLSISNE